MQQEIIQHLHQPARLEEMYRQSPTAFTTSFNVLYPDIAGNPIADTWHHRLKYQSTNSFDWGTRHEILLLLLLSVISGCCWYLPLWFKLPEDSYFEHYLAFILFLPIALYYFYKKQLDYSQLLLPLGLFLILFCFVFFLPLPVGSATGQLRNLHIPFLLWSIAGYVFVRNQLKDAQSTIQYLQHNGNWLIFSGLLGITGVLFTALSIQLFDMIGIKLVTVYEQYLFRWVMGAFPLFSCYVILNNPSLVNRISPIIARIFAPLVLITLFGFLVSLAFNPAKIFNSRDLLIVFNLVLVAVMAIVLFSLTIRHEVGAGAIEKKILALLSLLTCMANLLALSAILYRLASYGFTPNRTSALGANIIMFTHLSVITYQLMKGIRKNDSMQAVENTIAGWMPVYTVWAAIVVLAFPYIFNMI
ncbi:MAG: hypothetical protein ACKO1T_06470 [Sediminibacterium sp.]